MSSTIPSFGNVGVSRTAKQCMHKYVVMAAEDEIEGDKEVETVEAETVEEEEEELNMFRNWLISFPTAFVPDDRRTVLIDACPISYRR